MARTSTLRRAVGNASHTTARSRRAVRAVLSVLTASALALVVACTAPPDQDPPTATLSSDVATFLSRFDEYGKVRAVLVARGDEPVYELWRGEHAHDYVNVRSI